jgi:O-antigen biosynthesis protein
MQNNNTLGDAFFAQETHAAALLILASTALIAGDARLAFKLIDRHCRLSTVSTVPHLVLRAQALWELGDASAAVSDVRAALAIAPEDIHATRRMLEWGNPGERLSAAERLIEVETDVQILKVALQRLAINGAEQTIALRRSGNLVTGWVAWNGRSATAISTLHGGVQQITLLEADPTLRLQGPFESAADFTIDLKDEFRDCVIQVLRDGNTVFSRRLPPERHAVKSIAQSTESATTPRSTNNSLVPDVTIIIPVYKNLDVTIACIDAAKQQARLSAPKREIIIINDDSPDPTIREYLQSCGLKVIENTANLGFAGSINQVLRQVTRGDVLLLNSDAILPQSAIDRLAAAAYSAGDIATVTPMSNNGELTSYPIPFAENPFPDEATVKLYNDTLRNAEAGSVVDLPNGIGFCLYITRHCLDAIGTLPEIYERGYFEDVHFCLDAAAKSLRNVCATNVFVPHHGAQSFGPEKRALVVRNLSRLEKLFPDCRADTVTFMQKDPLKHAREKLERAWIEQCDNLVLAIANVEDIPAIQAALAQEFTRSAQLLLLTIDNSKLRFGACQDGRRWSSNVSLDLVALDGRAKAEAFLLGLRLKKIVITNPCRTPAWLTGVLSRHPAEIELLLLGTQCQRVNCNAPPDPICNRLSAPRGAGGESDPGHCTNWAQVDAMGPQLRAIDDSAYMFSRRVMAKGALDNLLHTAPLPNTSIRSPQRGSLSKPVLGIVPVELTGDCQRLLHTICKTFAESPNIVVLGQTRDDLDLMKSKSVFVTGPVMIEEFETLARHHQISHLLVVSTRPVFGHPFQRYLSDSDFPLAYFDWSMSSATTHPGDALLSPARGDVEIASQLKSWCLAEFTH